MNGGQLERTAQASNRRMRRFKSSEEKRVRVAAAKVAGTRKSKNRALARGDVVAVPYEVAHRGMHDHVERVEFVAVLPEPSDPVPTWVTKGVC
jgi:hypothetical protein